jgi:hypothetical protein
MALVVVVVDAARYRREILAQGKPAAREERPTGNLANA